MPTGSPHPATGVTIELSPGDLPPGLPVAEEDCEPTVMVDLGTWMLLRLALPGAPGRWHFLSRLFSGPSYQWVAVSHFSIAPSWHGLRVALYGARSDKPGALPNPSSAP
jgi:hypothetical protein